MNELDQEAWDRWVAFRKAIRKPIKSASESAMKLKLQRYGADQAAVVDQSISNQWQGLFDLKVAKQMPGEKPVKTDKQVALERERLEADQARCASGWDKALSDDRLAKLKIAEALLARYGFRAAEHGHSERIEWLRGRVAELLREAKAGEVLGEPSLLSMVRSLFGERGVYRLQERAKNS